jgi:DNA-binding protein HU-beta
LLPDWKTAGPPANHHDKLLTGLEKQGDIVNKSELIEAVAASADLPKAAAARVIDAMIDTITESLQRSEPVVLVGFGTFGTKERAARAGRNPQTGAAIQIKAAKVPGFKPGKALKDAVNA